MTDETKKKVKKLRIRPKTDDPRSVRTGVQAGFDGPVGTTTNLQEVAFGDPIGNAAVRKNFGDPIGN
jgi:hypothetical protein